jgi:hypothetical protein
VEMNALEMLTLIGALCCVGFMNPNGVVVVVVVRRRRLRQRLVPPTGPT